MAVHSFSTKTSNKEEVQAVERIKAYCELHGLNFSAIVVRLLIEWEKTNVKSAS